MKAWCRHLSVLLLVSGCILPPPVSLDNGSNQNPYIIPKDSTPPTAEIDLNLTCNTCTFQVHVEDPDAGDTLYAEWFWDYDAGSTVPVTLVQPISPSTVSSVPRQDAAYRIPNLHDLLFDQLQSNPNSVHTLQVLISDRPYSSDSSQTPINQVPESGGLTTTLRWTVKFITRGTRCDVTICSE